MTNDTAISTAGLTKHYPGVAALTDLSLDVPAGSIYGFLGPNGAGKSTTIKMLAGLDPADAAAAPSVAGIPVAAGPGYRREVGYLAQEPRVLRLDDRSRDAPLRRLALPRRRIGLTTAAIARRPRPGRPGRRRRSSDRRPTRAGCASDSASPRRSSVRPSVLLLDEPVSALDPIGRREVLDLMRELKGEATVFYSTHILDDVERVSDHVAILDGGRLVRVGPDRRAPRRASTRTSCGSSSAAPMTRPPSRWPPCPGVASVEPVDRDGELRTYLVRVAPGATDTVQVAITRFGAEHGLIVAENQLVRLDLEDVFLRLVNTKERAA